MPRESLSNTGFVCKKHAPKANPEFESFPASYFVGKYCKLGFPTGIPAGDGPELEWMWVMVTGETSEEDQELIGYLDNDPYFVDGLAHRDTILFKRREIAKVV